MTPLLRVAAPGDTADLARLVDAGLAAQLATPTRWYPGTRTARLRHLAEVIRAETMTRVRWSVFWVAESGAEVVGAVACYDAGAMTDAAIADVVREAQGPFGSRLAPAALGEILASTSPELRRHRWVLDLAMTVDGCDRLSVLPRLIEAALEEGRQSACKVAYAEVPVCADKLRRAFRAQGFTAVPHCVRTRGGGFAPVECLSRALH